MDELTAYVPRRPACELDVVLRGWITACTPGGRNMVARSFSCTAGATAAPPGSSWWTSCRRAGGCSRRTGAASATAPGPACRLLVSRLPGRSRGAARSLLSGQRVDLVGHSMGGNVAATVCRGAPERVRRHGQSRGLRPARHAARRGRQSATGSGSTRSDRPQPFQTLRRSRLAGPAPGAAQSAPGRGPRPVRRRGTGPAPTSRASFVIKTDPTHRWVNPVLYRRAEAEACWRSHRGAGAVPAGARVPLLHRGKLRSSSTPTRPGTHYRDVRELWLDDCGHMLHWERPVGGGRCGGAFPGALSRRLPGAQGLYGRTVSCWYSRPHAGRSEWHAGRDAPGDRGGCARSLRASSTRPSASGGALHEPLPGRGFGRAAAGDRRGGHRQDRHAGAPRRASCWPGGRPERILLLTFTRRAAVEMTRRARRIVAESLRGAGGGAGPAVRLPWSGTFHSIASRLLREYAANVGLEPGFSVWTAATPPTSWTSPATSSATRGWSAAFPRKDTCLASTRARSTPRRRSRWCWPRQFPWCDEWEPSCARCSAYVEAKQRRPAARLRRPAALLVPPDAGRPLAPRQVGERFDHVLVDEYQDTNRLQAAILLAPQARRPRA
jgi:pimeloyl-ACP methyl ester carboxylesterase